MSEHTHQTAPTRFVETNGIRFAYRRFGKPGGVPLVFNQHFTGTMDYWDPAVTDGLARNREVILFDNAGVSSSSGAVPASFPEMGRNAIAFIGALGLAEVDVLGFSIGGMVAQEITAQAPDLVRRLILVGTGPRGADMSASKSAEIFAGRYDPPEHLWLAVHFSPSASGRAAGLAFLERKLRRKDRDPEVSEAAGAAQRQAVGKYTAPGEGVLDYLKNIRQPTLIVQGSDDVIIPTKNSFVLQQTLPNAQLVLYPDSNHGSFYQYPELFVAQADRFLTARLQDDARLSPAERLPFPSCLASASDGAEANKALVLAAFDTLFNKRDYAGAARFWSDRYIQHSAHIAPGRDGLFDLVRGQPATLRYENQLIVAEGDYVIAHGRFSGHGRPASWIAADVVRIEDGKLAEHWDVLQDEATRAESVGGLPMFSDRFPS